MPDLRKMTLESLRALARKKLGPAASRLRTKGELVRALEGPGKGAASPPREKGTAARSRPGRALAAKATRRPKRAGGEAAPPGKGAAAAGQRGKRPPKGRTRAAETGAAGAAAGPVRHVHAPPEGLPDPEGYFVARVRGEEAVREAPHPMAEVGADRPHPAWAEGVGAPVWDERLGELPQGYGDDAFVALPRDPRSAFLYWDHARDTIHRSFEGLDQPRTQLWIFARAEAGWDRVRTIDFALESRSYYVHDLEPGRTYRAEIHALDRQGRDRLVGRSSNEVTLPRAGPSPLVDDRFVRIPWDVSLGSLLGPGHPGAPFSEEARRLLERLSDWTRFAGAASGSAGGMGGRPSSPTSPPSSPGRPREQR